MSLTPIDLLSSSSYPIPAQSERRQRPVNANMFLGGLTLLSYDDTTMAPTNDKSKPKRNTNNKSAPKSEDDTNVSKRKRGRPRVLDKDENAAERRRTQIRLAQRAYRSRKEATISSLSKRLSELDASIREMNTTVGSFRDELMSSGLLLQHTSLTYGWQRLVQKSDALVKLSAANQEYESANTSPMDETASSNSSSFGVSDALFVDQPLDITENLDEFNFPLYTSNDNASSINFDSLFQSYDLGTVQQPQQAPTTLTGNTDLQLVPSSIAESFPQDPINTNTTVWLQPSTITPPATYSFHESSFAGRLRRQCAEYAYRLLTDPNTDPKEILRTYRFSLCFKNKQALIERFWKAITAPPSSASDIGTTTGAAEYTVGNAGFHYPLQQPTSNPQTTTTTTPPPRELYPVSKFIGPWPFHQADAPHDFTSINEVISARGMVGEWFDSNDVEGYLREKGIQVDTQASFVTLPDESSHRIDYIEEHESPTEDDLMLDPGLESIAAPATARTQDIGSTAAGTDTNMNTKPQPALIFDVDMFLTQLIYKGVCLSGRAGFRKQDVENCLRVACYAVA
ncbi:hypothetical protein TMatcc_010631 [Talaromyces marneffei ATCC 18224]|uniref:BZIP transcription factor, putative n=1 Tax=Talaromyces marneffei (strain ATCC 18224 / CBS 334.59 / QM 7333) TaxID=441960 RepID=B6QV33_TALMQ|nr:uncharacterized protein EYB26_009598 [Talaromyces marneffei]EEA18825.1 bZIP transcription factor, putative [Talaromyces marneffei ATCC 18224]KAE8548545.1 hypothetical protein EYB25_008923 [Talaromyces marneffei]QGA21887.1 hypothetical protein EYB26_009598 [Talaromyces marneffei]